MLDKRQAFRNRVFDNAYEADKANYKRLCKEIKKSGKRKYIADLTTKAGNADRQNRIIEVYNTTKELHKW